MVSEAEDANHTTCPMAVEKVKRVLTKNYGARLLVAQLLSLVVGSGMIIFGYLIRPEFGNSSLLFCSLPGLVLMFIFVYLLLKLLQSRKNEGVIRHSAIGTRARVIDQKKSANYGGSSGDVLELIFIPFLLLESLLLERYKVVVQFEALGAGRDSKEVTLEIGVNGNFIKRYQPGAKVRLRYARQDPRIAVLQE